MFQDLRDSNSSQFQVSEFILMGFPGIHSWQHWLSLPPALLYLLALRANILILTIFYQEASLHQPMYHFLGILAVVDMGLTTTIMPKILAILWFSAKAISLPECFAQMYAIHCFVAMESGIFIDSGRMKLPLIPVLLKVLHNVIPPALNPMVYALKNKEL
ncbi:Hypothetical predicted protein, partial [Marmota monax]